jgi:hypothetical protein
VISKALPLALFLVGCAPSALDLGDDPDFYFWSDFERGNTKDFTENGVTWENAGGELSVVESPARSGKHALRSRVVPGGSEQSAALVVVQDTPEEAYYSAWFYAPEVPAPSYYWVFFKLGGPEDGGSPSDVWAFDLDPSGPDTLRMRAYSDTDSTALSDDREIDVATWFHVEGYLRASADDDGVVKLWVDGRLVFEFEGRMDPSRGLNWTIGGGSERLEGGAATLIIDDAAITRRRLTPKAGPFRGR